MNKFLGLDNEYMAAIARTDVVIDATDRDLSAKITNHICTPNSREVVEHFLESEVNVVFIEAIIAIPPGGEVLLDHGWSISELDKLVICECNAANCKGYI